MRETHENRKWLKEARALVEQDFGDPWSLSSLADAVGVHRAHLAREFRRAYGCSVGEYLRQRRLEYVCRALATSDASVNEIAAAAGFADQSHLTKVFKRFLGVTPLAYRKLLTRH